MLLCNHGNASTYNLVIAFMMSAEAAIFTEEAAFEMERKLSLTGARTSTLWTGYGESTRLGVVYEFRLAWKDALATNTLEVIFREVIM
jgi:hypothetical protein